MYIYGPDDDDPMNWIHSWWVPPVFVGGFLFLGSVILAAVF